MLIEQFAAVSSRLGKGEAYMKGAFRKVLPLFLVLACVVLAGCEKPIEVSGTVQYAGKPLPQGSIRFFPQKGTTGDGASAEIVEGAYEIAADANIMPGNYAVMVTAMKETGRMILTPDAVPVSEGGTGKRERYKEEVQYIPNQYNYSTKLKIEILESTDSANFVLDK
jgi:hypothetical protein